MTKNLCFMSVLLLAALLGGRSAMATQGKDDAAPDFSPSLEATGSLPPKGAQIDASAGAPCPCFSTNASNTNTVTQREANLVTPSNGFSGGAINDTGARVPGK